MASEAVLPVLDSGNASRRIPTREPHLPASLKALRSRMTVSRCHSHLWDDGCRLRISAQTIISQRRESIFIETLRQLYDMWSAFCGQPVLVAAIRWLEGSQHSVQYRDSATSESRSVTAVRRLANSVSV
jgi:hypothetical protein